MATTLRAILPDSELLKMHEQMVLSREFEESCAEQYTKGHITGFLHLYSGQEAVAVGATAALRKDDYILSAYREHAQAIVRGAEPRRVMAELFGKATGMCKGKGGSMHLFDPSLAFMGGYAIVGGQFPIAVGLAFASKYRKEGRISACFFGDGAVNQGTFHESLNWARLWELPVLFICENNFYGIGTAVSRASALSDIHKRTCGYDIPSVRVDGMDVMAVHEAVKWGAEWVREHSRPYLIEAMTYRFRGHSMADPGKYRSAAEVELWKSRDPIPNFEKRLVEEGIATEAELAAVLEKCRGVVADAVAFAEESPWPEDDEVYSDIYV
ncbi:pyruvate dehydrogenase (acetyl-transferring) E1 component subunit alpha [Geobacter sulfurreducens]|uniref:Pyruvate dehydrogenase E1 component subunit alpha n=1 Tax=Geobacter sulfurreducens (strain ATCC 51573 / DSM 12127 / PCA) TaxID=243231 RepID=Q74AD3_GEOSL|nr:pyruvate dehydrogenase (acetyl-transferring) E1 component subunit alpha [Geobacter sulfurreducens]AAR35816.1 pyruvate dehydrogenase complex, E1 protein, alpha subunit [Geobacter sulfurreducens PCA]UAC03148.1 pyruvate dehydrogenase (acetyl-transferring) E1 component subunit alpha [Geobacter sulfurreducens]HBB68587.1 pyruvate dehydrogenase (acetyl-transferring) E1 component subunit alpha [Geobacter sulfurreducens]HCD97401.1 pyruvate dehydrogenase (acetyl-transferring) E1 component subunit alph